jgi:hypothetical protein
MRIYDDKNMSDQSFILEESIFNNCKFKNCEVFYSGGDFEFSNLSLDNTCFHFGGAAKSTQFLFQTLAMFREAGQIPSQLKMSSQKPD